jgi:hypothetical protein
MRWNFLKTQHRMHRGITLTETLVAVSILLVIGVALAQVTAVTLDMSSRQSRNYTLETNAALLLKTINDHFEHASGIELTRTFGATSYTSSSTTLILRIPSLDSSRNIITGVYDYIVFYRDPNNPTHIKYTIEGGAGSIRVSETKTLTTNNTGLTFRYNAQDIVSSNRISVALEQTQSHRNTTLITTGWTSLFLHNTQ